MVHLKRHVGMVLACLLAPHLPVVSVAAMAATAEVSTTDPMISYRAYEQAIQAGNLKEAADHAQTAWQAAEGKWGGSNPNTAGLAYNAAWSAALANQPNRALEPARRAVELAPGATQAYRAEEAAFLLAYAEFFTADKAAQPRKAVTLLATAKPVARTWGDMLFADGLIAASYSLSLSGRFGQGLEASNLALSHLDQLNPKDSTRRPLALLGRGIAKMMRKEMVEAHSDVLEAQIAYGPERTRDDGDWAKLQAWGMVMDSLARSTGATDQPTGTNLRRTMGKMRKMTPEEAALVYPTDQMCQGGERPKRISGQDIRPASAGTSLVNIGGVLARVDLNPDGSVANPRVLGVVPDEAFAEAVLKGLRTWRYDVTSTTNPACLKDFSISVVFMVG